MNETRYGYESRCYEGAPAFERYDPAQCPQRPYGWEEERYHDPHLPTPMKTDQSEETSSGPIYPRCVMFCLNNALSHVVNESDTNNEYLRTLVYVVLNILSTRIKLSLYSYVCCNLHLHQNINKSV